MIRVQVLERAGERLRDLRGGARSGVVGKTMILAIAVGELGLKKEFAAADGATGQRIAESLAHRCLEVVLALICSIEGAKAGAQCQRDQLRGAVFLPGSAVNECWSLRVFSHSERECEQAIGSNLDFVHVAPAPVFAGLERFHDGVLGPVKMLGGVAVGRAVAASDVPAGKAQPKVDPLSTDLQAIFATLCRRGDILDFFNVFAGHASSLIPRGVSGFRDSMLLTRFAVCDKPKILRSGFPNLEKPDGAHPSSG